jgi:hypothetical protein
MFSYVRYFFVENVIELAEPLRNSFKDAYTLIAQGREHGRGV